ncbi:Deleted in malignant brain tumors 1 protein [Holothuria leucospilota]|uniref:Deleted in malignant brain tumors 1 protein n=1 Tax=Holothuria leucospilota TaxID=206669 RepID=A0A9Q1BAL3_HOLLE|nr:Deleted in malignant brain tumors 1 protein [Holothuria leucospilota]
MMFFYRPLAALSILPLLLCQECGDTITAPTYNLSSPNYPENYPSLLQCKWKISVEKSSRIHLWFTDFEFETKGFFSCNDYLRMWDGGDDNADRVFKSCAKSLDDFKAENKGTASFNSSRNMFYLWMTTNLFDNKRGFSATYISIPEPATATETVVGSTDAQSTLLELTTSDRTSSPQSLIVSTITPFAVFSSIALDPVTAVSENISDPSTIRPTNRSTTLSMSSDIPSLEPNENPPSSKLLVVVPTVSLVLLLVCLCVTGLFIHTRRSNGKSNTSSNDSSCHDVGTNPVRTVEEQCEPYSNTLYYTNESFHASPQGTYPPPYQSIKGEGDFRSAHMNVRILPGEEIIGDVAYESFDEEEKRNSDYTANAGHIANIAYESYGGEKIVDNGDYTANVGEAANIAYESYDTEEIADNGGYIPNTVEVTNIAYESYDGEEIADNGSYTANVGEVSNIVYESHDGQGKSKNDDNVFNEDKTSNVVHESNDRQENSGNRNDTAIGEVSNVAYESFDGENNVTYDTDEDSMGYEAIDDSQTVDDDYSKIR